MQFANWERIQQRYAALWDNEVLDRPMVSIRVRRDGVPPRADDLPASEEWRRYMDEAFIYQQMENQLTDTAYYGDAVPSMPLYLGTCAHGAYTQKLRYSVSSESVWLHPVMDGITDALTFNADSEFLHTTNRIIEHCAARCGGRFLLSNTDNCSNLDALASLRGINDLLLDMLDEPDAVTARLVELDGILRRTEEDYASRLIPINGGGVMTDFMQLWSEGYHHQLQCDMAAMISPALFEEFAVPDLSRSAQWMKKVVYHLDGQEQIKFLDMLFTVPNVKLIQWTPVDGQPPTSAFLPELKRIQAAGKGLVLFPTADELPLLLAELSPKGTIYVPRGIGTEEEARSIMRLFDK